MAEDPREIAGMVEKAMGAGGAPTAEGEELDCSTRFYGRSTTRRY